MVVLNWYFITQKEWIQISILNINSIGDIEKLIENKIAESLNIEYKASAALTNKKAKAEISKDVSAMANSAGGIIIYGVIEENDLPIAIDEGVNPQQLRKEWLEQVISSNIQRKIPDVNIKSYPISDDSPNLVYVVDIPQSKLAPHMASDNKYYKRYNFQATPMEEYEVRDISNREFAPDLCLEINEVENTSKYITLHASLVNHSQKPADTVFLVFDVDLELSNKLVNENKGQNNPSFICIEEGPYLNNVSLKRISTTRYYDKVQPFNDMPVIKDMPLIIRKFVLEKDVHHTSYISVNIISPHMTSKRYTFKLKYDGESFKINTFHEPSHD